MRALRAVERMIAVGPEDRLSEPIRSDVLILGCGIAGGTAALELAEAGLRVVIVTRASDAEESNTSGRRAASSSTAATVTRRSCWRGTCSTPVRASATTRPCAILAQRRPGARAVAS